MACMSKRKAKRMPYTMIKRDACEICSSKAHDVLIAKSFTDSAVFDFIDEYYEGRVKKEDLEGHNYEVVCCKECSFIWQSYILDDMGMGKLYADWISKDQSLAKKEQAEIDLFVRYSTEVQEIARLIDKKPYEIHVLDFGMGWGFWCLMAKAHGYNAYGYELSQDRVEYAENERINVIKSIDINQDLRFDFINSHHVFEHIPQPAVCLKQLSHLLIR